MKAGFQENKRAQGSSTSWSLQSSCHGQIKVKESQLSAPTMWSQGASYFQNCLVYVLEGVSVAMEYVCVHTFTYVYKVPVGARGQLPGWHLKILLPRPLRCWDCRHAPPCLCCSGDWPWVSCMPASNRIAITAWQSAVLTGLRSTAQEAICLRSSNAMLTRRHHGAWPFHLGCGLWTQVLQLVR